MKTDSSAPATPRPVSLMAIVAVFVLLSAFGLLAERVYFPVISPAPQNETPDNLSKDMAWKATPASRKAYMLDLKKKQAEQAASYGWVDQKKGIVQLPIDRAMELIVQENGGAK